MSRTNLGPVAALSSKGACGCDRLAVVDQIGDAMDGNGSAAMGATMRVLVLDDKPDAALLRVLRTMGAVPLVARTEGEAIVIINAGIDAAIVHMQLEPNWRYGGITVIRYLREHLGGNVPVILFTGYLDESARTGCEQLNARYIVKPGPTIASLVDYLRENQPTPKPTHLGSERRLDDEDGLADSLLERHLSLPGDPSTLTLRKHSGVQLRA